MRRRGLSLLEIQVALLLLLMVCLYLMSLFASGQRHARRALEYSRASVLAQQRLEEARVTPVKDLVASTRNETEPYDRFKTELTITPYENNLSEVSIRVTGPTGAQAKAFTLVSDPTRFSGVASDPFTHSIAWVNGLNLMAWNEVSNTVTNLGAGHAENKEMGALAGAPGSNLLWRGGSGKAPQGFLETTPNPRTWMPVLADPGGPPSDTVAPLRFSGLSSDHFGNSLVAADTSNRGLWFYQNGAWLPDIVKPLAPPLGRPSAVVSDPALSLVWVADEDHQCLRKFLCPNAAAQYPPADLEPSGTLGSWHKTQFRPPARFGFGAPAGMAIDYNGYSLFVHDRARLYRYIDHPTPAQRGWQQLGTLPSALIAAGPSGMACDRFGSRLYITAGDGSLWRVRPVFPGSVNNPEDIPSPDISKVQ